MRSVRHLSVLAATVALTVALGASFASAQSDGDPYVGSTTVVTTSLPPSAPSTTPPATTPPEVEGVAVEQPPAAAAAVTASSPATVARATTERSFLAFTGSDVTTLLVVGGIAVAAGLGLLAVRRRQLGATA